jgi:HNH endonuclease
MSVEIPLTQGKVALIDAEDAEKVLKYKWHACQRAPNWYAATSAERRRGNAIYLHRLLANPTRGEHVDHINGDGLDCRRENLRLCTNAENRRNMRVRRGVSQFKGVAKCKSNSTRVWEAYIWFNNRKIGLGNYETEIEAARAYNAAALKYHGDFACLNEIPGLTYEESTTPPIRKVQREIVCAR